MLVSTHSDHRSLPLWRQRPSKAPYSPARGLVLAALGVVFGDIGTSPLYSMQTVFAIDHHTAVPSRDNVIGIISLVIWSILLIVCIKYVTLVMRADNGGEGGILALMLCCNATSPHAADSPL